jgi:hypothetical protein
VDFTREPIVESVITPREGFILAVRSSKGTGQEEYFVDALELVSFGNALFFRSLERPKNFLLPVTDYEVLEVREARLVLKNVGLDRSIKIGGGRDGAMRGNRPAQQEKGEPASPQEAVAKAEPVSEGRVDGKLDKRRDRRRNSRRKRGRDETPEGEGETPQTEDGETPKTENGIILPADVPEIGAPLPVVFSSLLPPPATLISETIARYKDNALFRGAFFLKEDKEGAIQEEIQNEESSKEESIETQDSPKPTERRRGQHKSHQLQEPDRPLLDLPAENDEVELPTITLDMPAYSPPEMTEEEEEKVYQQRQALRLGRHQDKESDSPQEQPESDEAQNTPNQEDDSPLNTP